MNKYFLSFTYSLLMFCFTEQPVYATAICGSSFAAAPGNCSTFSNSQSTCLDSAAAVQTSPYTWEPGIGYVCEWKAGACVNSTTTCDIVYSETIATAQTTNCAGNSSGWPVYNNGANENNESQICGNGYSSGTLAIGGLDTQTWYSNVPSGNGVNTPGNWRYYDGCSYVNDDNVSVTTTGEITITPWSATATNWLAPAPGNSETRNWASGALWGTGSYVGGSSVGDWVWVNGTNYAESSGLNSPVVELWEHGCNQYGEITVFNYALQNVNSGSTSSYNRIASLQGASPQDESSTKKLAHSTSIPVSSKQDKEIELIEKHVKLPSDYTGGKIAELAANCPKGFVLMDVSVHAPVVVKSAMIDAIRSGIEVSGTSAMAGQDLTTQILCRKTGLAKAVKGGYYWGTPGNDILKDQKDAIRYYGGPGNDSITSNTDGSLVNSGLGNDIIKISGKDSVGIGGPGNDKLTAVGDTRIRLEGGIGKDKLFGNIGTSILDARDGHGGDQVICSGIKNIALVDAGDIVKGVCAEIVRSIEQT